MLDWQSMAVALIILAACAYVARRGLARLRSFRAGAAAGLSASSCATGCGGCGEESKPKAAKPAPVLVQISAPGARPPRRSR